MTLGQQSWQPDGKEAPKVPTYLEGSATVIEDDEGNATGYSCDNCGAEHTWEDEAEGCCSLYECDHCGDTHSYEEDAEECCLRYECHNCGTRYTDSYEADDCCYGSRGFNGVLPDLPALDPIYRIDVPEIEGRPARLCSMEQELTRGGSMVAALLYDIGLSQSDSIDDYSSSAGVGRAHVKSDGSLPSEGGEVVFDRFDLSKSHAANDFSFGVGKIRQLRDLPSRPVSTGYQAGIHIHMSCRAENGTTMTPRDVAALYELWCYAEDMLYGFSAAGWERHRQPSDNYGGYCKAVPKELGPNTPKKVWRVMRRDRYYGLNFQRLFNAVSSCSCGAATMGDWNSCDCGAFDRATVEWRVFNSSTLPRTIHAWIVMAHAMTAYAADHELGTLPENPYGSGDSTTRREVLDHLLDILPLTDGERIVIREAASRSPGL